MTQATPDPQAADEKKQRLAALLEAVNALDQALMGMAIAGVEPPEDLLEEYRKLQLELQAYDHT